MKKHPNQANDLTGRNAPSKIVNELQKADAELHESPNAALDLMKNVIQNKEPLSKREEEYRLKLEQEVREHTADLKASQQQYASLVENTPDVITRWDKDLKLIFANPAFVTKTGMQLEGLHGKTNLEMGQPYEIAMPYMNSLQKVFETGEAVEHFNPFPTPHGEAHYYSRIVPEKNDKGEVETVLGIARDITDLKTAHEQIKQQALYIERIAEAVPDMISVTELATRKFQYLNKETFKAQGFDPEIMNARNGEELNEIIHPGDRQTLADYFQKFSTASGDDVITAEYRAKDDSGQWKCFLVRGRVFQRNKAGAVTHILNVIENITERKKAEQEILRLKDEIAQKVTDKYLTLFNSIDEAVIWCEMIKDKNGKPVDYRLLELNPAFEKMTGLTIEGSKGKTAREVIPNIKEWRIETCAKVAFEGKVLRFENKVEELGRWFNVYASPVGNKKDGQFVLVYSDITKRKKEEERQAYLLQLSDALRQLNDPVKIEETAAEMLGKYLNASRVLYAEISNDGEYALISSNYTAGVSSFTGKHRMDDFGPAFIRTLHDGKTLVIPDIPNSTELTETEKKRYAAINIAAQLVVSLRKNNRFRLAFGVYQKTPRNWTDDEIALIEETAERSWVAIEKAGAEEALRKSEDRLRITMESAVDFAIITINTEGLIEQWNTGAERIFGYTAEEVDTKPADIIFTPEDRAAGIPEKEMQTAKEKGYAEDERWHQRKDGSRFFVSGVMRSIYDNGLTGYVKIARDITQQKLIEQQKDDFIGIASHELKTPITSIKAYTELLREMTGEMKKRDIIEELVIKLDQNVDRMIELIHALLDTTRIAEGQLVLYREKFNINQLIVERITEIRHSSENHPLIQHTKGDVYITADRSRIGEVLTNLISNAIKYSPAGGEIIICSTATGNGVEVSVKDKGVGIPDDAKEKIFERYYRVRNAQIDTYPGMGLGLYIAAAIVTTHGGKMWVESEVNKGSTFYFFLPYS